VSHAKHKRLLSVDLLRGVAVFGMIETHVVGLVLVADARGGLGFDVLDLMNGLVAPAFLFAAGFGAVMASRRLVGDDGRANTHLLRKLLRRALIIGLLGYAMRLPAFTPGGLVGAVSGDWANFKAVDVLQCIAVGWLLIYGLRLTFRTGARFLGAALSTTVLLLFGAMPVWSIVLPGALPDGMVAYLTGHSGSLFPLFPWLMFMTAGASLAAVHESREITCKFFRGLGWSGLVAASLTYAALWVWLDHMNMVWDVNPVGLTMRLAMILGLLSLAHRWGRRMKSTEGRLGRLTLLMGKHSLSIYVIHLLFLYRASWGSISFAGSWGGLLGVGGTAVMVLGVTAAIALAVGAWSPLRGLVTQASVRMRPAFPKIREVSWAPLVLLMALLVSGCGRAEPGLVRPDSPEALPAKLGSTFRVAYLGASVTCGQTVSDVWTKSYVALLNDRLNDLMSLPVEYSNYCVGSAMSLAGLVQLKREVLVQAPDLIVAEFGILDRDREQPALPANEEMIRLAHAAGIPFLMVATATSQSQTTSRSKILALARHYEVPVADMQSAMDTQGLLWSDVSNPGDDWHPNDAGHALLAEVAAEAIVNYRSPEVLPPRFSQVDYSSADLVAAEEASLSSPGFEPVPSDALKLTGAALQAFGPHGPSTLRYSFEGPVLGALFIHDAVPEAFSYRIDRQQEVHVVPPSWQKDHLLAVDLSAGHHEVTFFFGAGERSVAMEGILVVPGS
jgi:uncharacterized membrane protein/lysophospholipase L1-like esterase